MERKFSGGSESAMSSWKAQAVGESWTILVVDSISTPWLLNKEKAFLFNDDQSMMSYGDGDSKSVHRSGRLWSGFYPWPLSRSRLSDVT